jgi:hypothetical protein
MQVYDGVACSAVGIAVAIKAREEIRAKANMVDNVIDRENLL